MKRIIAIIFALAILLNVAYADNVFEQAVPFGIIQCSKTEDVYRSPATKNTVGNVSNNQICAILSSESYNRTTWYKIVFFSGKTETTGYIQSKYVKQLTISGLINLLSDSKALVEVQRFSDLKSSAEYTGLSISAASVSQAFSQTTAAPTKSAKQTYILNTKTHKFHYPNCQSVRQMKESNKQEFTGTREEIINMGYSPCGNCNP